MPLVYTDIPGELYALPPVKGICLNYARWTEHTVYEVLVSMGGGNPQHRALFYTGFLSGRNNEPGGYNRFILPYQDSTITDVYYMHVKRIVMRITPDGEYFFFPENSHVWLEVAKTS